MNKAVGDREVLERVVREHAGWVFAAARRRVREAALAEDVTQAVFLLYWRKGVLIADEGKRAGWLYRAVRYCSANALRLQRIRRSHEREAAMEQRREVESAAGWSEVEIELEEAMDRLSEEDRRAVVLRFYRGLSLREVGEALGIGEEAARKRVERSVGKLRDRLAAKGVAVEAASLAGAMLVHAAEGGPVELAGKVVAGISDGPGGAAQAIAEGAGKMMAVAKVKAAAMALVVTMAVAAGAAEVMAGRGSGDGVQPPAGAAAGTERPAAVAVLADSLPPEELQRLYELIYLLRHKERGPRREIWDDLEALDAWCDAIRQVVAVGEPAVPYLIAELDSTKSDFCMRNVAFALRAIGDRRAVPALLRAMPRAVFASNDAGVPVRDPELARFMVANSVEGIAPQVPQGAQQAAPTSQFFYYHRPITEIDAALRKLTGHSEGDAHLRANPVTRSEAEQRALQGIYKATAERWQKWWDQNRARLISEEELASVALPPVQGDPVEVAGKAKFGDLTGADVPLGPMGHERFGTRFSAISQAVSQKDAKAAGEAVAGTLADYQTLARDAAERKASGKEIPEPGVVTVIAEKPEQRVALLEELQKAVADGDWTKARNADRKLNELGTGIFSFTVSTAATQPTAGQ